MQVTSPTHGARPSVDSSNYDQTGQISFNTDLVPLKPDDLEIQRRKEKKERRNERRCREGGHDNISYSQDPEGPEKNMSAVYSARGPDDSVPPGGAVDIPPSLVASGRRFPGVDGSEADHTEAGVSNHSLTSLGYRSTEV